MVVGFSSKVDGRGGGIVQVGRVSVGKMFMEGEIPTELSQSYPC